MTALENALYVAMLCPSQTEILMVHNESRFQLVPPLESSRCMIDPSLKNRSFQMKDIVLV